MFSVSSGECSSLLLGKVMCGILVNRLKLLFCWLLMVLVSNCLVRCVVFILCLE